MFLKHSRFRNTLIYGQRILKEAYSGGAISLTTWYIGGCIYEKVGAGSTDRKEIAIERGTAFNISGTWEYRYELSDHLGNVRAVIRQGVSALEVMTYTDYYPYGWTLPGRAAGTTYRYGFQGEFAEKDPETGWNAFELRMYDSRIARWSTTDPAWQYHSPYTAFGNAPHQRVDPNGGTDNKVDNTIFVDANGKELYRTKDNLPDAIVVIDDNMKEFANKLSGAILKPGGINENDIKNLRKFGDNYMVDGMIALFNLTLSAKSQTNHVFVDNNGNAVPLNPNI